MVRTKDFRHTLEIAYSENLYYHICDDILSASGMSAENACKKFPLFIRRKVQIPSDKVFRRVIDAIADASHDMHRRRMQLQGPGPLKIMKWDAEYKICKLNALTWECQKHSLQYTH